MPGKRPIDMRLEDLGARDSANAFIPPSWAAFQHYVPDAPKENMMAWGKASNYALPENMGTQISPGALQQILQNVQLSAMAQQMKVGNADILAGGGRIGYGVPTNNGYVSVGAMMGGHRMKANTPNGPIRDSSFGLQGLDASYSSGDSTFGAQYQKLPMGQTNYNLFYRKAF